MRRAPWPAGFLFSVALAVLVILLGPLLLFNPPLVFMLQDRHQVAERSFDGQHDAVDAVTLSLVIDIWTDGAFDAGPAGEEPLLDQRERSHMRDVSMLVRLLAGITVLALVVALVMGAWLRGEPRRLGRLMLGVGAGIGLVAVLLAVTFAVAFEPAFRAFHAVFFPPGTYLFEPGSKLIALFPQGFWFDAALLAGVAIVLTALAVTLVGLRLWRDEPATRSRA